MKNYHNCIILILKVEIGMRRKMTEVLYTACICFFLFIFAPFLIFCLVHLVNYTEPMEHWYRWLMRGLYRKKMAFFPSLWLWLTGIPVEILKSCYNGRKEHWTWWRRTVCRTDLEKKIFSVIEICTVYY